MGLIDGVGDALFGDSSLGGTREMLERNRQLYENIDLPEFAEFVPEAYTPDSMTGELIGEDPVIKARQMQALEKMLGLADEGLSAEDKLAFENASSMANQESKQIRDAALQNAEARGVAGSGLEFALGEMGNQGAAERARRAAMEQAASSARMRALNNQAYMSALGNQRGQDFRANQANTNILNQFNQANTQNRNQAQQYNVGNRNQAQLTNNDYKQRNYTNEMTRADGISGANRDLGNAYAAEQGARDNRNNMIVGGIIKGGMAGLGG